MLWAILRTEQIMKPNGVILLILATTFLLTSGFSKKFKYDFALIIGNCYESDTLQIKINGKEIIDSLIATTDSSGYANISVIHSNDGLFVFWKGDRKRLERLELKKEIEFEISVNGAETTNKIDLRKGKILIADYCPVQIVDRHIAQKLTFRQPKISNIKKELNLE